MDSLGSDLFGNVANCTIWTRVRFAGRETAASKSCVVQPFILTKVYAANMSERVTLKPCEAVDGSIRPPGSKSITNRALICAAMAKGQSTLTGVLDSEDTQVMIIAWQDLGMKLHWDRNESRLTIEGCAGKLKTQSADLFVANSGTTIRFLTAALAACEGEFTLDGVPRMRERPIQDLLVGLRSLGADVKGINETHPDCPPVQIKARGLGGGIAKVAGNVSSQFLSGLMMAAPYARTPVQLIVEGELVSKPYVAMTAAVMKSFGVSIEDNTRQANSESTKEQVSASGYIIPAPQVYQACEYAIEPDASAASYFLAAAAITGGRSRVLGLSKNSLQGDVGFADVLAKMGCQVEYGTDWVQVTGRAENGLDIDMNSISDTVQTLAAVALFANGPTRIRGVAHNRHKETDRIGDLATELRKVGATVNEFEDGLEIIPGKLRPAVLETYRDHRMAMSLSLIGLKQSGIWILNPKCTEKTYPNYFEDMAKFSKQEADYQS